MSIFAQVDCDLCVAGLGMAGLNALAAASRYLTPGDRVIVVEPRSTVGGMWGDAYSHVRLHQPYRLFTVGNMPWELRRERDHLATRTEVSAHLDDCWEILREQLNVEPYFGYAYVRHEETITASGPEVLVRARPVAGGRSELNIRAKRFIKALGFDVQPLERLEFSTQKVRSITPESPEFLNDSMLNDDTPIYIVGGGKTGTDTARAVLNALPKRSVHMVVGQDTAFIDRSRFFPTGIKRYWGGTMSLPGLKDIAMAFDGHNDDEAFSEFAQKYAVSLSSHPSRCLFAIASQSELDELTNGLTSISYDYVEDVRDDAAMGLQLLLRSGASTSIQQGSWIVNCSGYLLKHDRPSEPVLSEHGTVLIIQQSSAIMHLTSFGAYFLTHLWYLERLRPSPIFVLNHEALFRKNPKAYFLAAATQLVHNILEIMDRVPMRVMLDFGLNFDNWYPAYRTLAASTMMKARKPHYTTHLRRTLERIETRYRISCRPID